MLILFKGVNTLIINPRKNNQSKFNKYGPFHEKRHFPAFSTDYKTCSRSIHFAVVCRSNKMVLEAGIFHTIDDENETFTNQLLVIDGIRLLRLTIFTNHDLIKLR